MRVIGEAAAAAFTPRPPDEVARARARARHPRATTCSGSAASSAPSRASASPRWPPRRATLPLVLAGPAGRWARELDDVIVTGHVSDDDLAALYTGARALVFASDDEGFGLPPVEALACGTPVVACDVPGAARGPRRPRDASSTATTSPASSRPASARAGPRRRRSPFTWEDAARATWAVYAEARSRSRR